MIYILISEKLIICLFFNALLSISRRVLTIVTCYHWLRKNLLFSLLKTLCPAFTRTSFCIRSLQFSQRNKRAIHAFEDEHTNGALGGCTVPKKERKRERRCGGAAAYISRESEFIDSLDIPISGRDMSIATGAVDRHRDVQEFVTRRLSIGPRELPKIVETRVRMHK